ncbi:MAG TPA: PIN domain-containing protein [Gemmatimonadota bacterium]|jgi:predicted nucleic acid-binding protein
MGVVDAVGTGPVALDTAVFIYFIEEHPRYLPLIAPIFQEIDRGGIAGVTSAITLLEVLVVPYRAGNFPLAERYERLLSRGKGLRLVALDAGQMRAAAQLRAFHGVRTPDALQLAAALTSSCTTFVTNDREIPDLAGIRVLQLADQCEER